MTSFSYQLYSSREFPPLENTLKMLSNLGYTQVEGVGYMFDDASTLPALRDTLDANGLHMATTHAALDTVRTNPEKIIQAAKILDIKDIYIPYLEEQDRPTDTAGWIAFAQSLDEIAKPIIDAGLVLGWHNHNFEFTPIESGELPIDLMLQASTEITFEFDVAWGIRAGIDPMLWIEKNGSRISSAHLKDIAPPGECTDEDGWADLGFGVVNWAALLPALKAGGTKYFVMEHDNPSDHERFARRSLQTARSL